MKKQPNGYDHDMTLKIDIITANISQLTVDAIVSIENEASIQASDFTKIINQSAGAGLRLELMFSDKFNQGDVKITKAHDLKSSNIIHVNLPRLNDDGLIDQQSLASCYRNILEIAIANDIKTIAIPAISYDIDGVATDINKQAAKIAINSVKSFLRHFPQISHVIYCCFDNKTKSIFDAANFM